LHLSPELTICYANAYLETVLGYSAAAVLGHSFLDFVSPAEQNLARTALQTSEGDPDCAIEIHCQHRQGATVVLELTSVALPRSSPVKGWIVTARDVTPRHATVAALKSSEQRFRSLVAHLPDAVFRLTADRTACFVSRRIEAMTGYRESELLGNTPAWRDLCHPHDRTRLEQTLRELTPQSPGYAVEYRVLHSYQPPRWVVEQGSGRFVAGRLVGYDGILIDRHEQKMADVQLAAILEVLPDGILVVNHRAKVVKYNQTFLRLWGIPEAILQAGSDWEMIEWLLHRLTDADACQLLEQTAAEYLQPQLVQAARLTLKNGAVVERHSRPYALDGVMVGRVMTFRLL
jgi:PAS domain S-box-containing protein